jgi:hypothetical protein
VNHLTDLAIRYVDQWRLDEKTVHGARPGQSRPALTSANVVQNSLIAMGKAHGFKADRWESGSTFLGAQYFQQTLLGGIENAMGMETFCQGPNQPEHGS